MNNTSEYTRPLSLLTYASAAGVVGSTIYLNNKTNALNARVTDLTDTVDSTRTEVKDKITGLETGYRNFAVNFQNLVSLVNTVGPIARKTEKRFDRIRPVLEAMGEALENLEDKHNALIAALKTKGTIDGPLSEELTIVKHVPKPKKVVPKRIRYVSESEPESESSEEEAPPKKHRKHKHKERKSKSSDVEENNDEDDISQVIRMASQKKRK